MDKKKFAWRLAFGLIITCLLLYYLLKQVSISELLGIISDMSIPLLALSFVFYFLSTIFRAARFRLLLLDKVGMSNMFSIVSIQNFLNKLIPMRLGELSYVYYLKKGENISLPRSTASLILARLFDTIMIFLFLMFALLNLGAASGSNFYILPAIALLIIIGTIVLIWQKDLFVKMLSWIISRAQRGKGSGRTKRKSTLITKAEEFFSALSSVPRKEMTLSLVFSLLVWAARYFSFYCTIMAAGFTIHAFLVMIAFIFLMSANLLPIPTFGDFGSSEGAWAIALVAFGVPIETAILSGFIAHLTLYLFNIPFGIYGFATFKAKNKLDYKEILKKKLGSEKH